MEPPAPDPDPVPRWRRAARPAAAVMLGAATAFGAAELALRVTRPDALFEWRSGRNPMSRWAQIDAFCAYRARTGDYLSGRKTVDRDGFFSTPERDPDPGDADPLRIAFLGGSSTAGTVPYLADEETWPWQVVDRLREALPDRRIEFVNAAVPGYSTFESYGRLWARLRAFRPHQVVVYHGWNDMYYFADAAQADRWRVRRNGSWGFDAEARWKRVDRTPGWLRWSVCLSTAHALLVGDPPQGEIGRPDASSLPPSGAPALATSFDPAAVDVFRDNLRLMLAAQDVLGFELHVAKQATLIVPDLAPELRERCGYRLHGFDHDAHVAAYDAIYRAIDATVPGERVIDCRTVSGDPELLTDHVHLSAAGATRVATLVADHLGAHLGAARPPAATAPR